VICSADGCNRARSARGLCSMHYLRARRAGELPTLTEQERFMQKVLITNDGSGCAIWCGAYTFRRAGGSNQSVKQAAYELFVGDLPLDLKGRRVHTTCGDSTCVAPAHLTFGRGNSVRRGRKLTPDQVREIKAKVTSVSQRELGARYGVSPDLIHDIIRGKIYRDVIHHLTHQHNMRKPTCKT